METVGAIGRVRFVNDSKATNADAHDESIVTAGPVDPKVYAIRPDITLNAVPASRWPLYSENSAICGP